MQITPVDAVPPSAPWTPTIVTRGKYEVFARWQAANGRATNAPFTVYREGGGTTVRENQEQNNNTWMSLGTYVLAPGQNHRVVLGDDADGCVTADGLAPTRWTRPTTRRSR